MWPHGYIILWIITQCYFILLLKIAEKQFWYFFKIFGIFSQKPTIIFSNIFFPFSSIEGTICLLKVKVKSLSHVWLFSTPWTVAYQAPPSMGFSRQEYWSGVPFSSPRNLPDPRIEPGSPALQADPLLSEPPGKPNMLISPVKFVQLLLFPPFFLFSMFLLV